MMTDPVDRLCNAFYARNIFIPPNHLDQLLKELGLKLVSNQHNAIVEHLARHAKLGAE